jgi:hypothetical protein
VVPAALLLDDLALAEEEGHQAGDALPPALLEVGRPPQPDDGHHAQHRVSEQADREGDDHGEGELFEHGWVRAALHTTGAAFSARLARGALPPKVAARAR